MQTEGRAGHVDEDAVETAAAQLEGRCPSGRGGRIRQRRHKAQDARRERRGHNWAVWERPEKRSTGKAV